LDAGASDERAIVAFGLIIGNDDQVAVGATAFPSPADDLDAPWLWHGFMTVSSVAESGTVPSSALYDRLVIDSKAMRKVKSNQQIVLTGAVGASVDQTGTWDLLFGIRVLIAS